MIEVGNVFIGEGHLSMVFFTKVAEFEGKRLQTRLVTLSCSLVMGGICCDGAFSTVLGVPGATVMGVL